MQINKEKNNAHTDRWREKLGNFFEPNITLFFTISSIFFSLCYFLLFIAVARTQKNIENLLLSLHFSSMRLGTLHTPTQNTFQSNLTYFSNFKTFFLFAHVVRQTIYWLMWLKKSHTKHATIKNYEFFVFRKSLFNKLLSWFVSFTAHSE